MDKETVFFSFVMGILKKKPIKAFCICLTLVLLLTGVFFCRKPVILVLDRPFAALYGESRRQKKQFALSLGLFRPIKTVNIAEGSGPDLAAQGAAGLSRRPFAVFFPYRYREGARRYRKNQPDTPVIILGGRNKNLELSNSNEPLWVWTDTKTDLYRAGIFAGIAARQAAGVHGRGIALYWDEPGEAEKAAFQRGLREQQWYNEPLLSPDSEDDEYACAVFLSDFPLPLNEEAGGGSFILFSWMDPSIVPQRTLAVFDDSPWAQIGPVLENIKKGAAAGFIPSDIIIPGTDKTLKMIYKEINEQKTLKYGGENADN